MVLIVRFSTLWEIVNILIMVLRAFSVSKIVCIKKSKIVNWVISALIICLPVYLYTSAGLGSYHY